MDETAPVLPGFPAPLEPDAVLLPHFHGAQPVALSDRKVRKVAAYLLEGASISMAARLTDVSHMHIRRAMAAADAAAAGSESPRTPHPELVKRGRIWNRAVANHGLAMIRLASTARSPRIPLALYSAMVSAGDFDSETGEQAVDRFNAYEAQVAEQHAAEEQELSDG